MKVHRVEDFEGLGKSRARSSYAVYSELTQGSCQGTSEMISIKMVLSGEEHYHVGSRRFKLQKGQFLLTPAGAEVQGVIPNRAKGLCLFIPNALLQEFTQPSDELNSGFNMSYFQGFNPIDFATASTGIGKLLQKTSLEQLASPESEQMIVESLAGHFDYLAQMDRKLDGVKSSTRQELLRRLERAKAFILANLEHQVDLAELAQVANLSKFHLNRLFKVVYGEPPLRLHQNFRLDWALEQLQHGKTTSQVSELLNFASVTGFSRAFFRRHGVRPSTLRHAN
ncbi:helix-turn-helix domain-containing protein [Thalassotalea ganghwensis]